MHGKAWFKALGPLLGVVASIPGWSADWNARLAADYLDHRQKLWFEWAPAKAPGGPCISCHTGLTYLLARPMLRRALGEKTPTTYEDGLLNGLRARMADGTSMFPGFRQDPLKTQGRNFESALALLLLTGDERPPKERLTTFDSAADGNQGLWGFRFGSAPWESDSSSYFTAALVALANRDRPGSGPAGVPIFMKNDLSNQPLHQKLMALWARVPGLEPGARAELEEDVWKRQKSDGSWSDEALGPWPQSTGKPAGKGSSAYATAFVAFVLQQAGIGCADDRLTRAKSWLRSQQDATSGAWRSLSMNKTYAPESLPLGFMDDAATGFAVMALLDPGLCDSNRQQRTPRK
jgi:hypothetical protein